MSSVSLIVLNYNGEAVILDCLKAIDTQTFRDFELIIVDNNSNDSSVDLIERFKRHFTLKLKTSYLKENVGFSSGNLEGLKYAEGEYIVLLNNDTEADKYWLEELVKAMNEHPEVGICASKIIAYGRDVIDSAGDGYTTLLKGFKRGEGGNIERFNQQEYVFGACSGAALYRKNMLEEIGFLDKDFFLIHEDTDLNFRAQLYGWKVLYVPTALVYHKVRSSIGHMSEIAVYYTLRNSEFVRIKNVPFSVFLRCLPEFIIGTITEFIYFTIKHRRLRLYFKAKADVLRMFPEMLKKRAVIMRNKKVNYSYLLSIITSIWQKDFLMSKIKKLLYG
jgi:GT2 family glycosyltransferase